MSPAHTEIVLFKGDPISHDEDAFRIFRDHLYWGLSKVQPAVPGKSLGEVVLHLSPRWLQVILKLDVPWRESIKNSVHNGFPRYMGCVIDNSRVEGCVLKY